MPEILTDDLKWYEIHDNLCLTADYMAGHGYTVEDIAYFVEKPYKYESEFEAAKQAAKEEAV